jgi:hypothetical protein
MKKDLRTAIKQIIKEIRFKKGDTPDNMLTVFKDNDRNIMIGLIDDIDSSFHTYYGKIEDDEAVIGFTPGQVSDLYNFLDSKKIPYEVREGVSYGNFKLVINTKHMDFIDVNNVRDRSTIAANMVYLNHM